VKYTKRQLAGLTRKNIVIKPFFNEDIITHHAHTYTSTNTRTLIINDVKKRAERWRRRRQRTTVTRDGQRKTAVAVKRLR